MKKITKFSLILVLLFVMAACSNNNKDTVQESVKEKDKKEIALNEIDELDFKNIENGGFFVNNKGVVVGKKETKDYKIIEWYFDPLCSHCMKIEEKTSPYLFKIMGEKTLINYKPLTFLGRPKNDDPKNPSITYSDVMSSIILSMAENDPNLVSRYIAKVVNKDFVDSISKLNDTKKQNEAMKNIYINDLSGRNWDKIMQDLDKTMMTARNLTNYVKNDNELKKKTLDGKLSVPLIYVRGEKKILDIYKKNMDYRPLLEEKLK